MPMLQQTMPLSIATVILIINFGIVIYTLLRQNDSSIISSSFNFPVTFNFSFLTNTQHWINFIKIAFAFIFLFIIYCGLAGTPVAEQNFATVTTWLIWWTGIIIAVLFTGSLWCSVCPWETISNFIQNTVAGPNARLNLRVPAILRNIWPATFLLVIFTWLELGIGISTNPYATSLLALFLVIIVLTCISLFKGKAFCRYMCPIGRTIGVYAQFSPVRYRTINSKLCANCHELTCYHGTENTEACPTQLVMGRMKNSMYCISCGECQRSCHKHNVILGLKEIDFGLNSYMRLNFDLGVFIVVLLSLTSFHGMTMTNTWSKWINELNRITYSLDISFIVSMLLVIGLFILLIYFLSNIFRMGKTQSVFTATAVGLLPLAFSFHIAHNLKHITHDNYILENLLLHPLGGHATLVQSMGTNSQAIYFIQMFLIVLGFWYTSKIISTQIRRFSATNHSSVTLVMPGLLLAFLISSLNLWILTQPMLMRM